MPIIRYTPSKIERPPVILDVPSAWKGLEYIINDMLEKFGVGRERALEFGVEFGYSIVALSNFFKEIVGVDTFEGDEHTLDKNVPELFPIVRDVMPANVRLVQSRYQDYKDDSRYDLIHVDIVHTYEDTFACGDWAMQHSNFVIFHDTESFPEVKRAVIDLAKKHTADFYNYPHCYGLGILWKKLQ